MNGQENPKTRHALVIALALNVVLALALLLVWWRSRQAAVPAAQQNSSQMPAGGEASAMNSSAGADSHDSQSREAANNEPSLAQIQLTPQRMQSIGVTLGTARMKAISNDIRVTGNVDVDERRLATVQLRFPGWIRKVFVDATYDYVHKGQPLFTIYSPDLVTTEQEYLLARKNQQQLLRRSVS